MTLEEFREKAKDEEWAPGWDAVESVFKELYGEQDPAHYATDFTKRAMFGGTEYIDGYSVYKSANGYQHIVTFGMTELYADEESLGGDYSRWGYEMTMKLPCENANDCLWAIDLLGNLGRYTYSKGSWFEPGHFMSNMGQPIKSGSDSLFVGITNEEYEMLKADPSKAMLLAEAMKKDNPFLITDINRKKSYIV